MKHRFLFMVAALTAVTTPLLAKLKLAPVFQDHAILQAGVPVPVWDWADPGQVVEVSFDKHTAKATAGSDGRWQVSLPVLPVSANPGELTVRTANGETLKATDVLVGEVWFCSGQSNMAETVATSATAKEEAARPEQPLVREFRTPPKTASLDPQTDCAGEWKIAGPTTIKQFSATAYYFAHKLQNELHVPVGLITSAVGATRIESWISRNGYAADLRLAKSLAELDKQIAAYRAGTFVPPQRALAPGEVATPAPAPDAPPRGPLGAYKGIPSSLYNSQISPHAGTAIRGFLWYQGEANRGDANYILRLSTLIKSWRADWKNDTLPFYVVQIAPFDYKGADRSPEMWEQQALVLTLPHIGLVTTLDIGDLKNIHPPRKREVGERLANLALKKVYGRENLVAESPLYASHKVESGSIQITLNNAGGGLASRDGQPLTWFTIAGEDGVYVPAEAQILGTATVRVSSPQVPAPKNVRFAWGNMAEPNLMNKEGLPAAAFRTDAPTYNYQ